MRYTGESAAALASSASAELSKPSALRLALRNMANQDWIVLSYLVLIVLAVARGERNADYAEGLLDISVLLVLHTATLYAVRGELVGSPRLAGLLYRFMTVAAVEVSYFFFRKLLPIINPSALDRELYALDMRIFGIEPAFAFEPFVTPALTEWFSFIYWFYFFVISLHIVPMVWRSKNRKLLNEFTLGLIFSFCLGHLTYFLVPGFGPGIAMSDSFRAAFPDGFFFRTMTRTVETGGALKDIFPSIHTAIPTYLTLWSIRHRREMPFRYTWPFMAFFAVNVIIATMYLRWHYLIDVVAGLTLAGFAFLLSVKTSGRETSLREKEGRDPVWPEFDYFSKS